MKFKIPNNAIKIRFKYGRDSGTFHVWKHHDRWQWDAFGNCGEERSMEEAIQASHRWITVGSTKSIQGD